MTSDGAAEWLDDVASEAPAYVNSITVASLLDIQKYDTAGAAGRITVPLRVVLTSTDTINPPAR